MQTKKGEQEEKNVFGRFRKRVGEGMLLLLLCLLSNNIYGQDPQFSQYYAAPLLIAPSFAGNSLGSRAFMNFRDQWAKLPGAFVTYSVAVDNNFYALNSGFGLVAMRDVAGSAGYGTSLNDFSVSRKPFLIRINYNKHIITK